jgi:hypothetical protein
MGLKGWFLQWNLKTARSNLRSTLEKLVPMADAAWDNSERCLLAEVWPLPEVNPEIHVYQKQLLEVLTIRKGQLTDRDAVEFIGSEIKSAGAGAKMAVRHVVITEWPKYGKPAITQAEMEEILGSRDEDTQRTDRVRAYALHHLALEQAVAETTGKRPETSGSVHPTAARGGMDIAMWLQYIYMVLTVVMGIAAIVKGAVYPGVAGLIGPTLCWFAGSGLKGSLLIGTGSQKLGGLVAAIVFLIIGLGIVYHSGYWVSIFGYALSGIAWSAIGLAAGFLFTTKKQALA